MTTTTIDCDSCPVRGRHCGDCFVPVLARLWLDTPERIDPAAPDAEEAARSGHQEHPGRWAARDTAGSAGALLDTALLDTARLDTAQLDTAPLDAAPLDTDELAAVSAFVRAGLVDPDEAARARAQLTVSSGYAVG